MDRYDSAYPFYSEVDPEYEIHENVCASTGCDIHETVCIHSAAALDALDRSSALLKQKQWGALARLITESKVVAYNAERDALQFTGCNNELVGHLPIAAEDASPLVREITALNETDE